MLNRREFNGLCGALSSSLPAVSAMFTGLPGPSAFAAANGVDLNAGGRTVKFPDGTIVPALGQGSWHLGQGRHPAAVEEGALRTGLSLGMTLIDTAEGYSNGRSEELIGRVIAGQRDRVFLVSKVDHMTTGDAIARACEASLARLGTEHLDLYLAHWRDRGADLSVIVTACQELPRVLLELRACLKPGGVLFSSNPHGHNEEGWSRGRYGAYLDLETWRRFLISAGFVALTHYYRPAGLPRERQPWLATIWRR